MQIDKEKLLEWLTDQRRIWDYEDSLMMDHIVQKIESGTFDIKEEQQHADK